jgi:hypothetical protein
MRELRVQLLPDFEGRRNRFASVNDSIFSLGGPKLSCSNCLRQGSQILGNLVDCFHHVRGSYCAHLADLLLRASIPPKRILSHVLRNSPPESAPFARNAPIFHPNDGAIKQQTRCVLCLQKRALRAAWEPVEGLPATEIVDSAPAVR